MGERHFSVYIMASWTGTLYVGVTNDLKLRVLEHRAGTFPGFASRYGVRRLLYFEEYAEILDAIAREKQIKGWSRWKKVRLIESVNPPWRDLAKDWKS